MSRRRDYDTALLNTGTIRQVRRQETIKSSKPAVKVRFCRDCDKHAYPNEEATRAQIQRMIDLGRMVGGEVYAVRPYICHHGWWHYGRDGEVLRMFRKLKKGTVQSIPQLAKAA